jgi:hypothetical protein
VLPTQVGLELRFAYEPRHGGRGRELRPEHLDRDDPRQPGIPGAEHHAHPALAENALDQVVGGQGFTDPFEKG